MGVRQDAIELFLRNLGNEPIYAENTAGVRNVLDSEGIPYTQQNGVVEIPAEASIDAFGYAVDTAAGGSTAAIDALVEGWRLRRIDVIIERLSHLSTETTNLAAEKAALEAL